MASLNGQRLVLQRPKIIPRVGYLDWAPPEPCAPPSQPGHTSMHSAVALETTDWMRERDFSCFILRSQEITLQRAHLINAVGSDREKGARVANRIRGLGLLDDAIKEDFDLDHPVNNMALDPSMHTKMDLYGIWAITGSLMTLQEVLCQIKTSNQQWQVYCNKHGFQADVVLSRFSPFIPCFSNPIFEIVVLQPSHMIRDRLWFSGRPSSEDPNLPQVSSGNLLFDEGRLKIRTDDGAVIDYPPFCHHSNREAHNKINIFLILLNAQAKFQYHRQHFGLDKLSPDHRRLVELTEEIVEEIYFVPVPASGSITHKKAEGRQPKKRNTAPDDGSRKRSRLSGKGGPSSAVASGSQVDREQDTQTLSPRTTSPISDTSAGNNDPTDDEYGLTHEEMDILEARMADPTLTSKERAEAGMMYMFGNKTYAPLPEVQGLLAPSIMTGLDVIQSELG